MKTNTITVVKKDGLGKNAPVIWEEDFEVPAEFSEFINFIDSANGKGTAHAWLLDKWLIHTRATHDPRRNGALPKAISAEIKAGINAGDFSISDLQEFIKARKITGDRV